MRRILLCLVLLLAAFPAADGHAAPADARLHAGVGRADLTPPTGRYMWGWFHSAAHVRGQHTRLFARAIVLERGGQKVALVAADLGAIPGGVLQHAVALVKNRGFSEANVLVSASHTHAGPTGFFNFSFFNTIYPTSSTLTESDLDGETDRQLYDFVVRRLALAIERADRDRAPAVAGWGSSRLLGLTANRSIEAHLADHGVSRSVGEGSVSDDPDGYGHTIDPNVDVLRVDKVIGGRRMPVGAWSAFAAHGTVNSAGFTYYNGDHNAVAQRVVEDALRRAQRRSGGAPRGQAVVNAFGSSDSGDASAALVHRGPAWADHVGRREAAAMLEAWRGAGRNLSPAPELGTRWTRVCFCGQRVEGGQVSDQAVLGLPMMTGSEEGRGPLHDNTRTPHEGVRLPAEAGSQGHKVPSNVLTGDVPAAVPLTALRVGDRILASVPGEMTVEMGRRVRHAVTEAAAGHGVRGAVIAGLANEYAYYFTTPEEYGAQHYEGGVTLYGTYSSNLVMESLAELTRRLVEDRPAAEPHPFDPTNGVQGSAMPYPSGADRATAVAQPEPTVRLERARFAWRGGPTGYDRPLDAAFVRIQRQTAAGWRTVETDLGLNILWQAGDDGAHEALWEVALDATPGIYRFLVTANRYRLASSPFEVMPSRALTLRAVAADPDAITVALEYPPAIENVDITDRPDRVRGGEVRYEVDGRTVRVRRDHGGLFTVPADPDASVTIPPGAARDAFGNVNAEGITLR